MEESTLKLVTPEDLEKLESQSLEDEAKVESRAKSLWMLFQSDRDQSIECLHVLKKGFTLHELTKVFFPHKLGYP